MTISAGTKLGSYEILQSVGAGGMGEVYKATDTRLGRLVAIKVLTPQFSGNDELKQRFDREAQTIAGLTHPHICTLYDIGTHDETNFLVMEFLEGETLAVRMARGQMPLEEALRVAIQISQALDKAHTLGVTHRDLKPANIMLTKAGAKLMDFGLAKRRAGVEGSSASIMPTAMAELTQQGSIIGTVQYMAPEQIEGEDADPRTDIFALGMVIYEMVTGKKAFTGKSHASLMASILNTQPEAMSVSQALTPPALQRVIEICLAKDPRDRWQTAHDVMLQLKWIAEGGSSAGLPQPVAHRRKHREWLAWGVAAAALAGTVSLGALYFNKPAEEVRVMRFGILPNEGTQFGPPNSAIRPFPAISPDGKRIAYQGQEPNGPVFLYVRSLDALESQRLAGTEGAALPFWSPDSRFIAFTADSKLKRIDANGGPVQVLADVSASASGEGSWGKNGTILFSNGAGVTPSNNNGILSIPDTGGVPPKVLIAPNSERREVALRAPYFLPDGQHFLYLAQEPNVIWLGSLDPKEAPKRLRSTDSRGAYAREGYLLYVFQGTLMAQKLDEKKLELTGEPFPVAEGVRVNAGNGRTAFTVSENGTIVYRTGAVSGLAGLVATWFERDGKPSAIANQSGDNRILRLSPDEKQLLVERQPAGRSCTNCTDLWTIDLARGTNTRLTFGKGDAHVGAWSADGTRIFYTANPNGKYELFSKFSTGVGNEEQLVKSDLDIGPIFDASKDYLLFGVRDKATGTDIWYLPLAGDRTPKPFINTPFDQAQAYFSPDGHWVAYQSNESGMAQVYVQPFPATGQRFLISVEGGVNPRWRHDSKELLFTSLQRSLVAVDIQITSSTFVAGKLTRLFLIPDATNTNFTFTGDGKRFIFAAPPAVGTTGLASQDSQPLTVITNWTAAVKH